MKIFGVLVELQDDLIKAHCFGDCGRAMVGALVDDQLGEILPCSVKECPHLDRQMDEAIGTTSDGLEIYLRKIK